MKDICMKIDYIKNFFTKSNLIIFFIFIFGLLLILEILQEYDLSITLMQFATFSVSFLLLILILKELFIILNTKQYSRILSLLYNTIFFIISLFILDMHEEEVAYLFSQILLICYLLFPIVLKICKKFFTTNNIQGVSLFDKIFTISIFIFSIVAIILFYR